MIVKLSFLAVASFATFAVSRINTKPTKNQNTASNPPEINVSNFQQKQSEKKEEEEEEEEATNLIRTKMLNNVKETEKLSKLAKELEQRKVTLERKLHELQGLKEKQSTKIELKIQLEEKSEEISALKDRLASLQAQRKNLKEESKEGILAKKQLEMAKNKIVEMLKKLDGNAKNIEGKLLLIEGQVFGFQKDDTSVRDFLLEKQMRDARNVELEVVEMKRRNKEIELEKRDLSLKLFAAQARISSLSNMTEGKIAAKIEEERRMLRHVNEEMSRQIEYLQKNRFDMVQELVYQRWLQCCLRFEIQNIRNPTRQTSKPKLSKTPSPNLHVDEMEQLVLDSCSDTFSTDQSDEVDGISTTIESSSSSQKSTTSTSPTSLVHNNIRRWKKIKDGSNAGLFANTDRIHSFSTPTMLMNYNEITKEPNTFPRVRRVSFNDLVKADKPKSDEMEVGGERASQSSSSTMNSSCFKFSRDGLEGKEHDTFALLSESNLEPIHGGRSRIEMNIISSKKRSNQRMPNELPHMVNKVETHMVKFVTSLFLFLFIFLIYILHIHKAWL